MNKAMGKQAVKTFLKSIGMGKEKLAYVDLFFDTTWEKPQPGTAIDYRISAEKALTSGNIIVRGLLDGKLVEVFIQTEDPTVIPDELRAFMAGGK